VETPSIPYDPVEHHACDSSVSSPEIGFRAHVPGRLFAKFFQAENQPLMSPQSLKGLADTNETESY